MKSCTKIFVLLTICLKLVYGAGPVPANSCETNKLVNNPFLLCTLRGYLYTLYTTKLYQDNEIFYYEPNYPKNSIFTRTTNAAQCCKAMDLGMILVTNGNYYKYVISNDKNCPTQLTENARMKLLAVNMDGGGYCLMIWTCRTSREGIHAFCTHREISLAQKVWIEKQYKSNGTTAQRVKQNTDYKNG